MCTFTLVNLKVQDFLLNIVILQYCWLLLKLWMKLNLHLCINVNLKKTMIKKKRKKNRDGHTHHNFKDGQTEHKFTAKSSSHLFCVDMLSFISPLLAQTFFSYLIKRYKQ